MAGFDDHYDVRRVPPSTPSARLVSQPGPADQRSAAGYRARPRQATPARPRRLSVPAIIATLVAAFLVGSLALIVIDRNGGNDGASPPAAPLTEPDSGTAESTTSVTAAEPDAPTTAGPAPALPTPPFVQAVFDGREIVITGTVPDAQLVEQVNAAAGMIYAPFVRSDLQVDQALAPAPWLTPAPQAIGLLQTISAGTLVLADGAITLQGTAASADDAAQLEGYLAATGLPVSVATMDVTGQRDAVYLIAGSDGRIALSGALPTPEIKAGLAEAASAIYGPDNVFDASTVDPTVSTTLWMHSPQALIATLSAFPDFEVRLDGGDFSASLSGGAVFGTDSAEISPEFAQVLNFGVVVLARDPSMTITIEGHTDAEGPDDYNLTLSQTRADAVAGYFAAAGIDPSRIAAIGRGETAPAAPNDTAEGRARNRRVEFSLQSAG